MRDCPSAFTVAAPRTSEGMTSTLNFEMKKNGNRHLTDHPKASQQPTPNPFIQTTSAMKLVIAFCSALLFGGVQSFAPPQTFRVRPENYPSKNPPLQAFPTSLVADAANGVTEAAGSVWNAPIFQFFLETVIRNGVPAVFTVAVIGFTIVMLKKDSSKTPPVDNDVSALYDDLYGDQKQRKAVPSFLPSSASKKLPENVGVPKEEFIQITHLNRMYDSFDYSLMAATNSKAFAARSFRKSSLERALTKSLSGLTDEKQKALVKIEKDFLSAGQILVAELEALQLALTKQATDKALEKLGVGENEIEPIIPDDSTDATNVTLTTDISSASTAKLAQVQAKINALESDFIQKVVEVGGPENAIAIRTALTGSLGSLLTNLQQRPLQAVFGDAGEGKRLYVARFPGDVQASQVETLRQEVTAICRNAQPGDEVLVVLQSGGGTVTGYGLAAAQLQRFKQEAGLKLTIAVEQVAASGGYMMCCVADRIVASPFAVLGSIGVISDIPNVYERLAREGIEFQTVTAGKYKRTLTPTKKPTKQDFDKTKADVEDILVLFKDFVHKNRPQLDIDKVATGETWFGEDALERKLCDEIKTVDTVFGEYINNGFDLYEVKYERPKDNPLKQLGVGSVESSWVGRVASRLVNILLDEVEAKMASSNSVEQRYMASDRQTDRWKMQD